MSAELEADAFVEISELGTSVLNSEVSVPIYLELESVLSTKPLVRILELLTRDGPTRMGSLVRKLSRHHKNSSSYMRHLLFGLKQGFLELSEPTRIRSPDLRRRR